MVIAKFIIILADIRVGLKFFVISRTTGLYKLKFAKSSAPASDFLIKFHIIGRFCYIICEGIYPYTPTARLGLAQRKEGRQTWRSSKILVD
jgi:hypothetical protein